MQMNDHNFLREFSGPRKLHRAGDFVSEFLIVACAEAGVFFS